MGQGILTIMPMKICSRLNSRAKIRIPHKMPIAARSCDMTWTNSVLTKCIVTPILAGIELIDTTANMDILSLLRNLEIIEMLNSSEAMYTKITGSVLLIATNTDII